MGTIRNVGACMVTDKAIIMNTKSTSGFNQCFWFTIWNACPCKHTHHQHTKSALTTTCRQPPADVQTPTGCPSFLQCIPVASPLAFLCPWVQPRTESLWEAAARRLTRYPTTLAYIQAPLPQPVHWYKLTSARAREIDIKKSARIAKRESISL